MSINFSKSNTFMFFMRFINGTQSPPSINWREILGQAPAEKHEHINMIQQVIEKREILVDSQIASLLQQQQHSHWDDLGSACVILDKALSETEVFTQAFKLILSSGIIDPAETARDIRHLKRNRMLHSNHWALLDTEPLKIAQLFKNLVALEEHWHTEYLNSEMHQLLVHEDSVDMAKALVDTHYLLRSRLKSHPIEKISLLHAELKPLGQHEYFKALPDMCAAVDIYENNNKYCQSISDQLFRALIKKHPGASLFITKVLKINQFVMSQSLWEEAMNNEALIAKIHETESDSFNIVSIHLVIFLSVSGKWDKASLDLISKNSLSAVLFLAKEGFLSIESFKFAMKHEDDPLLAAIFYATYQKDASLTPEMGNRFWALGDQMRSNFLWSIATLYGNDLLDSESLTSLTKTAFDEPENFLDSVIEILEQHSPLILFYIDVSTLQPLKDKLLKNHVLFSQIIQQFLEKNSLNNKINEGNSAYLEHFIRHIDTKKNHQDPLLKQPLSFSQSHSSPERESSPKKERGF